MQVHGVTQGSEAWHKLRQSHFCASEAAAVMGVSPYMTRSELLRQKKTGIVPDVDAQTQKRFDDGHATEAAFRPVVERIIGQDLYPVVGTLEVDGLPLLASFDGLTADDETGYEHKRINNDLRAVRDAEAPMVPDQYLWQLEQQMLVSGACGIWFCASDGTEDDCLKIYYESDPDLRARLISGWRQFSMDLHNYQPEPADAPKPAGVSPESLPALRIELTGLVTASNLQVYKETALAVFAGINRELTTDQHFADAEKTVKWCGDIEDRIKAAKQHALSQTASIDELFRTMDEISDQARAVRLELDKLVKARKDAVRVEIVNEGRTALLEHVEALNRRLGKPYMPAAVADFAGAIKGKKNLASMREAVSVTLANAKIAASAQADKIDANLQSLRELAKDHAFLFADTAQLVMKENADLVLPIKARIAEHKAAEEKRLEAERERIRQEEAKKLADAAEAQRKADEKAAADAISAEQLESARAFVSSSGNAGISAMQRHLGVGYNVAARVLENLEQAGVVSAMDAYGKRTVLNAPPVSPPSPAEQPRVAPAVATGAPDKPHWLDGVHAQYVADSKAPDTPFAPPISAQISAFLASREWPTQAARNSARAVLIEFERFCAQQAKVAA